MATPPPARPLSPSADSATGPASAAAPTSTPAAATDYTQWTPTALIARIKSLESAAALPRAPRAPPRRPTPSTTTTSPHRTLPIALKFAYLGQPYNGYEHHFAPTPLPTVESVLFAALLKARLVPAAPGTNPERDGADAWPGDEVAGYSKCGRTDKGVSAFGQVVGLRLRASPAGAPLDYCGTLNRLLPDSVRVLAWTQLPEKTQGDGFSARFDCESRTYRYHFSATSLAPALGLREGTLDIAAMRAAAAMFEGSHDFRNFCKLDASKQITNFVRQILCSRIVHAADDGAGGDMYYFELTGTAFLWHQVRHMVAVLFLVGQRLERPGVVAEMLDVEGERFARKPVYEMADARPLVLWECKFPREVLGERGWIRAGREGLVGGVWEGLYTARVDGVLARGLAGLAGVWDEPGEEGAEVVKKRKGAKGGGKGHALVLGSGRVVMRGVYAPLEKRERMRAVEEINSAWVERKGDWRERRALKRAREEAEGES
ncbi:pseudouridine synthase [Geopyxis carbonaria]|nr:pseudouridine synthase [Geopyxis carbonaria]